MAQALQALTTMVECINPQDRRNQEPGDNRGAVGSPRTLSRTTDKPTHPTFVREELVQERMEEVEDEIFADILMAANDEWELLVPQVRERMTFEHFVNQRREHYRSLRQDRRPRGKNSELKRATTKLTMPTFDVSAKMTAQAWIHKLDTFLALRPMTEIEAIKYATLHLEGVAHDW